MRDIKRLGVDAEVAGAVFVALEVLLNALPGSTANVLEDDERWPVSLHPRHHATEGATGLAVGVNVLLLIVEVGIVDTRSPSHEKIDISGYGSKGTVSSGTKRFSLSTSLEPQKHDNSRFAVSELTNITKKERWLEVALNIRLLEGLNLTGENVLVLQVDTVLF